MWSQPLRYLGDKIMLKELFEKLDSHKIPDTKILAQSIAHTLSNPSKMPGRSYGIPAGRDFCNVGGKLIDKKNSVCSFCYACRGAYNWQSTIKAQQIRYDAIKDPLWPAAMVKLIGNKKGDFFRWLDSGDIINFLMLCKIVWIAKKTPNVKHWLPTKEKALIFKFISLYGADHIPDNLVIRISSPMIDQPPLTVPDGINTSTVHNKSQPFDFTCRAPLNNNECGSCRACWNKEISNVSYRKH